MSFQIPTSFIKLVSADPPESKFALSSCKRYSSVCCQSDNNLSDACSIYSKRSDGHQLNKTKENDSEALA